jgi:signal transduction histidine kinase
MTAKVGGPLALAFALAALLLIINGVVSYRSVSTLIENNDRVTHTQEILEDLQELRTSLLQVETDARGFLLTGDAVYENAYRSGLAQIPQKIETLRQKTADNQSQQQKFPILAEAVRSRLELLEEYVQRKQVLGATVIPANQSGEGKRRMDAVRAAINEIASEEHRLLEARVAESKLSGQRTYLTLMIANAVLLSLLVMVFFLTMKDIRHRTENERRLQAARDQLEERVLERTRELNEMNTELERSNRELQDFAFVASHDLQEPLRKIQAFGDRLRKVQGPKFDDQGRDYLDRMHNAAGRMHTLINDLLVFSRVTTKAQPFAPTDLNKIAADVVSDLEARIEETGGDVNVEKLPVIEADELQMRQLFQNLIANALKFRRPDTPSRVTVSAETIKAKAAGNGSEAVEPDMVKIFVKDNGIGFDVKYLDRIFTPFQRLHGRNEYEGTGIGLAVCRKIVERHGGTLTARSEPGEGSTFIATLPAAQSKEK